eukprot:364567-Chlamydomonas_euryale.AAC.2
MRENRRARVFSRAAAARRRHAPCANLSSPPSLSNIAWRTFLNTSQRYLKCACWLHSVLSQRKQSVPSWSGMGLIAPYSSW